MKKAIGIMLLAMSCAQAQAQLYIRAGVGYAIPVAGQTLSGQGILYNGSSSSTAVFSVKGASLSSGVQGIAGLGYMFDKHIGVQLDASVGVAPTQYSFADYGVTVYYGATPVPSDISIRHRGKHPLILIPSLVLQTGGDVWNIYSCMGIAVPLSTTVTQHRVYVNEPGTGAITNIDQEWTLKSRFSLGLSAAAGVSYKVNDRLSVWGEVSMLSLSVYLKQEDLTGYTRNGQDIPVSQLTGGNKTIYYSMKGQQDSNGVNQPTYSQPFSNVGISAGISFKLSDQKSRSDMKRERAGE